MLLHIPIQQIDDNPYQVRTDYGDTIELADRISAVRSSYPDTYGLMQIPRGRVIVDQVGKIVPADDLALFHRTNTLLSDIRGGLYRVQLAFGHRRLRAFRHLHQSSAPGYEEGLFPIHVDALTDDQMLDAVWSENRERRDISAVEEAELIREKLARLRANGGGNQADVAAAWGLARPTIANRLRLLELPAEIQTANRTGQLSERQCLALAAVVQLQQIAPPDTQWAKTVVPWTPLAPADYIARALDTPPPSDAIREYADKAIAHAGHEIPAIIGEASLAGEGVIQPTCRGCPWRMSDHCLRPECLTQKKALHIARVLETVSAETGYPISDRDADFAAPDDYNLPKALQALHEAGAPANFVIRWQNGNGYYPFGPPRTRRYCNERYEFDDAGRNGIALGHRGSLDIYQEYLPAAPENADIASAELIAAWDAESKRLLRRAEKSARAALVERCWGIPHELLQALLRNNQAAWIDNPDEVARLLIDHLWAKGGWRKHCSTRLEEFEHIARMMSRANIDVPLLADHRAGALRAHIVLALDAWYTARHWEYMATRVRPHIQAVANMVDAAGPWNDPDIKELRHELGRALAHAEIVCAQTPTETEE